MIYHLKGQVAETLEDSLIIDVNGVGYQVFVSDSTLQKGSAEEGIFTVYTYHHIREDQETLFGFSTPDDRQFFLRLTSVSGVGPKVGMKMLSTATAEQLIHAILNEDLAVLTSVPGIGKKVAERLVVELKDKLPKLYLQKGLTAQSNKGVPSPKSNQLEQDLMLTMKTLGYHQSEIKSALQRASNELSTDVSLESSIKILLRYL